MSSRFFRRLTSTLFWTGFYIVSLLNRAVGWVWDRNIPARLALLLTFALSSLASGTTPRKAWSVPEMINNDRSGGSGPNTWQIVFDARGNGIVVTEDYDRVWANRYTAGAGWGEPQIIDSTAIPAEDTRYGVQKQHIRIYFDPAGNAVAVWHEPRQTWINRYTPGTGWGRAEPSVHKPGDGNPPEMVADARGYLYAVWTNNDYKRQHHQVWANIHVPGKGWGQATAIAENTGDAKVAMIKVDTAGNVYAVWLQGKGKGTGKGLEDSAFNIGDVWISRYAPATGWGKPALIIREANTAKPLDMALDDRGNAMVVWEQKTKDQRAIWANRYLADRGWDQPVRLELESRQGDSRNPAVAFDARGSAIVMWWKAGSDGNVVANRYTPGEGWGQAVAVSTQSGLMGYPRFIFDRDGNALAVWAQYARQGGQVVRASRYTIGSGWSPPALISVESGEEKHDPRIALDAEGNAIAVWWQRGRGASIWVNHYVAGKGWGSPMVLQKDATFTANTPKINFDAQGIAHVTWTRSPAENRSYLVWTSRYQPVALLKQIKARKDPHETSARQNQTTTSSGGTPLHAAAYSGNPDTVASLLATGADVNARDYQEWTPLHTASWQGHQAVVELLIAKGADVNARSRNGETPLHMTSAWGTRAVAEVLIARGAHIHARGNGGITPLYQAATRGKKDIVALLIAKGANVNGDDMPLLTAVYENRTEIVALLLAKGAATNPKDGLDTTPLHTAASKGNREMVELLLAHGANVNARDSVDHTPLHAALFGKNLAVVQLLLARGADVNVKGKRGATPLHLATSREIAAMLIAKGANVNARGEHEYTPLHNAAREGRKDVAEALIASGAEVNAVDKFGETPLDKLLESYHKDFAEMLRKHGARKGVKRKED